MDVHLLRTFVAVARHGSFSLAARELGYTQSAVSQHIALLESSLGVRLLGRRPVAVTEPGARLLTHAGPILARVEAARADVTGRAGVPPRPVAVAVGALVDSAPLAGALARLRDRTPGVELRVRAVASRDALVAGVRTGRYDVGLVAGITAAGEPVELAGTGPLTAVGVGEQPLVVVAPEGHPLAHRSTVPLPVLADALWLDAPLAAVPLAELAPFVGRRQLTSAVYYGGGDRHTLLAMVAQDHGLAVLPRSPAGAVPPGVVTVAVPGLVHRTELLHQASPGPAAALFLAAL